MPVRADGEVVFCHTNRFEACTEDVVWQEGVGLLSARRGKTDRRWVRSAVQQYVPDRLGNYRVSSEKGAI